MMAAACGKTEIVRLLLDSGADTTIKDDVSSYIRIVLHPTLRHPPLWTRVQSLQSRDLDPAL